MALVGVTAVVVAGCGSSSPSTKTAAPATAAASAAAPVSHQAAGARLSVRSSSLGRIIVDGRGRTLYMLSADHNGKSSCAGMCAKFWPPYTTGAAPTAGPGVKASLIGTTPGPNGGTVVTYHGHPLYRFLKDSKPGQVNGEDVAAFGGRWDVLAPAGTRITKPPSSAASSARSGGPAPATSTTQPSTTGQAATPTPMQTAPPPQRQAAPPTKTQTTPAPTTQSAPPPPPPAGGTGSGIPQGGGGDGDADNSGGPSDGDGAI